MVTKLLATIFVVGSLSLGTVHSFAAESRAPHQNVQLSPDLLNLLRAEMLEIAGGVQSIALSLATADWESIQETSTRIRDSYIMEKKLTPAQAKELEKKLPGHFKQLDAEFHQRADRLGVAATTHDLEIVAFRYSRLLESCALCHSTYARSRFPGFASPVQQVHRD